jgi:hypothetical protein
MSDDSMKSRKVNWPMRITVGLATTLMALFALKACVSMFSPVQTATLVRGQDCASPTGALVATHLILMGGGAAGWVEHTVSIRAPSDSLAAMTHVVRGQIQTGSFSRASAGRHACNRRAQSPAT